MSLYAYQGEQKKIAAWDAAPQKDYHCLECKRRVRLRGGGRHRRPHFFHLQASTHCHQSGKSEDHLYVQQWLVEHLGVEAVMEESFSEIERVADVAWKEKQVIFEVQCSPISAWEVARRTLAYRSLGWRVVWVLDARTFSPKRQATHAERWLQNGTFAYFRLTKGSDVLFFRPKEEGREQMISLEQLYQVDKPIAASSSWLQRVCLPFRLFAKGYILFLQYLLQRSCKNKLQ